MNIKRGIFFITTITLIGYSVLVLQAQINQLQHNRENGQKFAYRITSRVGWTAEEVHHLDMLIGGQLRSPSYLTSLSMVTTVD
jgi:hypothetical protein